MKKVRNALKGKLLGCEEFRRDITAFLFRDISPDKELMMEQHRDSCPECREAVERLVPIECKHVFQHISSYIDGDVSADLRAEMEAHFKECKHCVAVLDGTRNIVQLIGDERMFEVPRGFSERLYRKIPKKSQ